MKKLLLNKESVRVLVADELELVAGGHKRGGQTVSSVRPGGQTVSSVRPGQGGGKTVSSVRPNIQTKPLSSIRPGHHGRRG